MKYGLRPVYLISCDATSFAMLSEHHIAYVHIFFAYMLLRLLLEYFYRLLFKDRVADCRNVNTAMGSPRRAKL